MRITTGTASTTIILSQAKWKGKDITVESSLDCPIQGHALEIMHHLGDDGRHWCPTMYLFCPHCNGVAEEPEPYECTKWGSK